MGQSFSLLSTAALLPIRTDCEFFCFQSRDSFYALIFATAPSSVTLSSSAGSQTTQVPAGVTRLSYQLGVGGGMSAKITRNGQDVVNFSPGDYQFVQTPQTVSFPAFDLDLVCARDERVADHLRCF